MQKNILVLTGSPRKGGNTDVLADMFIKEAVSHGHNVTRFATAHKKINGCLACDKCWSSERACNYKDDFAELEPLLESADMLVFVSPLYWYGFSAQLKSSIDKLYSYCSAACKRSLKIRESALLMCGGDDITAFNGAVETYKNIIKFLKWEDRGVVIVPGVFNKGDIANNPQLKEAELLGRAI